MKWTKKQKQVIDHRHGNLLVSAAAGSGKTAVLVERIIEMVFDVDSPVNIDELLVVTFTKAAAAQMKEKIAAAIEKKVEDNPTDKRYIDQLNRVADSNILTIDSFCYKVLKEYFHVISIDPQIQVAEEADLELIKQEVIAEVIEDSYKNNADFADFSNSFSADKDDSNIEEYIITLYELSESYPFPEKWFEQAKRNLHIESEKDLSECLYTRLYIDEIHRNAEEIRNIVLDYLNAVRSDSGPKHYEKTLLSDICKLDDIISSVTYSNLYELSLSGFDTLGRAKKTDVFDVDVAEMIKKGRDKYKKKINEMLKAFSIPVDMIIEQSGKKEKMLGAFIDATRDFSNRFLDRKIASGYVGFSDVEHFAMKILCEGTDDKGFPIPSLVGRELSEKFREILIDEYQDSNYLQEYILRCVSRVPYGENNIFMVGDVKQSIYGFRMARPDLFTDKYDTYSEVTDNSAVLSDEYANGKILLNNNFRSRENVLTFINYIFYQIMDKSIGGIDYSEAEALVPGRKYEEYNADDVELLLGESKDVSMLAADNEKEQYDHLDDEYIDISGIELEAGMVAGRIRKLVGMDSDEPHLVTDDDTGELRKIRYSDIVILFRAPRRYQPVFSEVLTKQNIPVKLQNENGYFDLVEIRGLITFLKMIDNPYNDVECAALLRGFFGGLDSNELAVFSILKKRVEERENKHIYLYQFLSDFLNDKEKYYTDLENEFDGDSGHNNIDFEELYTKCMKVFKTLKEYQNKRKNDSVSELVRDIYYENGYYYYVQSMPDGKDRSRNLNLFFDEVMRYERRGTGSLFGLLRFIKRISERGVNLGGDASSEITDDVVRIMSIHRSKGLEFPVVFVSGIGKQFNMSDVKTPVILHSDYYVGAKYVDPVKRCGNDSFERKAMATLIRLENTAEELRVFYVALTRAKEKLILSGVTPDITKLIDKYRNVALSERTRIDYSFLRDSECYLDLVTAALMRNRIFHDSMSKVKPRYDKKGNVISAQYEVKKYMDLPVSRFTVDVFYYNSMIESRIEKGSVLMLEREDKLNNYLNNDKVDYESLKSNLLWIYSDNDLTTQKSKLSVTEIKRMYQKAPDESADDYEVYWQHSTTMQYKDDKYKSVTPRFIDGKRKLTSSEKGTWFHKVMELIDNKKLNDIQSVEMELNRLYEEGRLIEETKTFITAEQILKFANSLLGVRMRKADIDNKLYKERKFVVGFPVKDNSPDVVVQGIIDAYFEEDGKLILVDYKTDNIKPGQEKVLMERYQSQIDYYRKTLEKITGMEVAESYLYSFTLNKEIKL